MRRKGFCIERWRMKRENKSLGVLDGDEERKKVKEKGQYDSSNPRSGKSTCPNPSFLKRV